MSASAKKPVATSSPLGRRGSADPSLTSPSARRGSPTPGSTASTNGTVARTRSIRTGTPVSARAAMHRSTTSTSNLSQSAAASETDDEARAETVALLDELKEQLRNSELRAADFEKQNEVLQSRLDETLLEQSKLEDRLHEMEERNEILLNEKREASRQIQQMESIYEAERVAMTKEKEDFANREEEMLTIIQRLKDSLSQRTTVDDESRMSRHSNSASPNLENGHFAPSTILQRSDSQRSDSRNNSKLILQKDRLIESLRLELAEAQIKLIEMENMGGGRLQEVERLLLESRMTNARLMEDNESYQLLLQERTLNGEFSKSDFAFTSSTGSNADALSALEGRTVTSSLADELSSVAEGESETFRKMELELRAAKDQNKALTLYINKIIERLLQHQDFEAILDQSSDFKPGAAGSGAGGGVAGAPHTDKELPPPPPKDVSPAAAPSGFLPRAKSVALGSGKPRPHPLGSLSQPQAQSQGRPMSQLPAPHSAITDPDTAPSIPFGLNRSTSVRQGHGQGRPQSLGMPGAAGIVNQMYRPSAPLGSPPLNGPQTPRSSMGFFAPAATARQLSSSSTVSVSGTFPGGHHGRDASGSSVSTVDSPGDVSTPPKSSPRAPSESHRGTDGSSPPRAARDRDGEREKTAFAGNKPRPLRLVQENAAAAAAAEGSGGLLGGNKRGSWYGWATGGLLAGTRKKDEGVAAEMIKE